MLNRKVIVKLSFIVFIVGIFIFIYISSPIRSYKSYPIADGTFIQLDLTQNWDDSKWKSELQYLKQNKMHFLIITGVSFSSGSETKSVYSSTIPGFTKIYGQTDPIDLCLKNAEELGIKVFVDTYFNNDWWKKSGDDQEWLYTQMQKVNQVSDELYSKYHSKYPKAFYGWYFPYEVDNAKFNNINQFSVLSNALNINLRHLKDKNERLPVLLSPFMNSSCSTPKEYADNWSYLFAHTDLIKGDIFCVQDSVGSGRISIDEVNSWFTALKKAVNTKPGLSFWANVETFDYVNNSTAPLNRFIKQLKLVSPCVDNIVCFSYSHYYSPNNISDGFQNAYYKYVKDGVLPVYKPSKPENLTVETINKNEFTLSWTEPKNTKDICGYNVYRNGTLIFSTILQRKYGGDLKGLYMSYTDRPLLESSITSYSYEVKSFDFSGNLSDASNSIKVSANPDKPLIKLLSQNCTYTTFPAPDYIYSDTNSKKLTDGIYSSINSNKDKSFVGWYNNSVDITIDLGKTTDVQQFAVSYLRDPISWVQLPSKASIAVSSDGINFQPVGLLRIPTIPFSERIGSKYKIYLTLDKPMSTRFIRLSSFTTPFTYILIDEFEVRSN